jgi:branched-chain amino acid aminotransferase
MNTLPISSRFDFDNFTFGIQATDLMLMAKYKNGAWSDYSIQNFQDISLSPLAMCFHYGQTVFEGLKAYRMADGGINIFRIDKHFERINRSLYRMAMPELPEKLFIDGIGALVKKEENWVIDHSDYSLYIRPFVIATEPRLGVDASSEYLFMIILSPMKAYYSKNLRVKVETEFIRAAKGGAGTAKNGGNYGASMLPQVKARKEGFDQIIWLDAAERKYVEESGTMNIMFIVNEQVLYTPALNETILDGVTRNSLIQIAQSIGLEVREEAIAIDAMVGRITGENKVEAFGVGTAAVISPFKEIVHQGITYPTYTGPDAKMFELKNLLTKIRRGLQEDRFGWNHLI